MNTSAQTLLPFRIAAALLCLSAFAMPAVAQVDHQVVEPGYEDVDPAGAYETRTDAELEDLVGPIALYPDDLVSIILAASTYPVQVVQAARYLRDRETDPGLEPAEDWDDAIVALLNYPEVIELLNDDLDWTWALGDAFLNQQAAVMDAVAQFRDRAYAAGNLQSDDRQVVRRVDRIIEIRPADPEVIYVPYYEPARVVVYQPYPAYFYYPQPRYAYYYPYPADYHFRYGIFFGVTTVYRLHWHSHRLYTYGFGYRGHPYYGHSYYRGHYFRYRPHYPRNRRMARSSGGYQDGFHPGETWRPRPRHGARPGPRLRSSPVRGVLPGDTTPRVTRQDRRSGIARNVRQPSNERRIAGERRVFTDRDPDMRDVVRRARNNNAATRPATGAGSRAVAQAGAVGSSKRAPAFVSGRPGALTRSPRAAASRLSGETAENPRAGTRIRSSRPATAGTRLAAAGSGATAASRRTVAVPRQNAGRVVTQYVSPGGSATGSRPRAMTRSSVPAQRPALAPRNRLAAPAARQAAPARATPRPAPAREQSAPARSASPPSKAARNSNRARDRRR